MEEIKNFNEGINRDVSRINQPKGSYRDANNISVSNPIGSISKEYGNKNLPFDIVYNRLHPSLNTPYEFTIIGSYEKFDDLVVLFLVDERDENLIVSEIGTVNKDNFYATILNSYSRQADLNFSTSYPIMNEVEGRVLFDGSKVVYWTDNNNPVRFLNLSKVPSTNILENIELFSNKKLPISSVESVQRTGSLKCGSYQIATRYLTGDTLNTTEFGLISEIVPIGTSANLRKDNNGGSNEQFTDKSITFKISNIDFDFPYIEIALISYDDSLTPRVDIVQRIETSSIQGIDYLVTIKGSESVLLESTVNELNQLSIRYEKAKAVAQKDARLFLSNVTTKKYDIPFQKIANNFRFKYKIKELSYNDRYKTNIPIDENDDIVDDFKMSTSEVVTAIDGYKDPINCAKYKSLMRDEVYSLGVKFIFKDGTMSEVYHIPAFQETVEPGDPPLYLETTIDDTVISDSGVVGSFETYRSVPMTVVTDNDNLHGVPSTGPKTSVNQVKGIYNVPETATYQIDLDFKTRLDLSLFTPLISDPSDVSTVSSGVFLYVNNTVLKIIYTQNATAGDPIIVGIQERETATVNLQAGDEIKLVLVTTVTGNNTNSFNLTTEFIKGINNPTLKINKAVSDRSPNSTEAIPDNPGSHVDGASGVLGVYTSDEFYESGKDYPTGKVRHFKMPTLNQEPHFRKRLSEFTNNHDGYILRVLGLTCFTPSETEGEATFSQDWIDLKELIDGYVIVREPRDTNEKKSIIGQGIIVPSILFDKPGQDIPDYYSIAPFLGKSDVNGFGNYLHRKLELSTDDGGYTTSTILINDPINGWANVPSLKDDKRDFNLLNFLSPDVDIQELQTLPNKISSELTLVSTPGYNVYIRDGQMFYESSTFDDVEESNNTTSKINGIRYIEPALITPLADTTGFRNSGFTNTPFFNFRSHRRLLMNLEDEFKEKEWNVANRVHFGSDAPQQSYQGDTITLKKDLCNIRLDNTTQYGKLYNANYQDVFVQLDKTLPEFDLYNGDVFITPYSVLNYLNLITYFKDVDFDNQTPDDRGIPLSESEGLECRNVATFFVESIVNNEFRHQAINNEDGTTGVDFVPANATLAELTQTDKSLRAAGAFDVDPSFEFGKSYNAQYSLRGDVSVSFPLSFNNIEVNDFTNRTIYSELSLEGESFDNYRRFLANNYQDIPKNTGPIIDSFVYNNTLYLKCVTGFWRTYINEREAVVSNISEVFVGNAGMFSLPAKMIYDAGSNYQWAACYTPFGYFMVDDVNGKVFLFGESFTEISQYGLFNFFNDGFEKDAIDNPLKSKGVICEYDPELKRVLLVNYDKNYTLSFSFINNKWVSFHDYRPNHMFNWRNKLHGSLTTKPNKLFKHNIIDQDLYYESQAEASITFLGNDNPIYSKVFDNISIVADENMDTIRVRTYKENYDLDKQDTGVVPIVNFPEEGYNSREVDKHFNLAVPRNISDEGRIRDKVAEFKLTKSERFKLDYVKLKYRINSR